MGKAGHIPSLIVLAAVAASAISPAAADAVVDWNSRQQPMSGFGASTAWAGATMPDDMIKDLFSAEAGCGLSLVRLRIAPAHYPDWANLLAKYAKSLEDQGVRLKYLSAQNEPNFTAKWESCRWTPEEIATFIGDYLGPALEEAGVKTRVMGSEPIGWSSAQSYGDALLSSPKALKYVDIIPTHAYEGTPSAANNFPYRKPGLQGKEFLETEVTTNDVSPTDNPSPGIWVTAYRNDSQGRMATPWSLRRVSGDRRSMVFQVAGTGRYSLQILGMGGQPLVVEIVSPEGTLSTLDIFTTSGKRIRSFMPASDNSGRSTVTWDGGNGAGSRVSPGPYIVQFQIGNQSLAKTWMVE